MLLNNVAILNDNEPVSISISKGKIEAIETGITDVDELQLNFENAFAIPGLINSHDHLDFNCFAPLGQRKYHNYTEWGNDIHSTYKKEIDAVLKIPQHLRARWGIYKNLLAGVTTVVNHGEQLAI